MEVTEWVTRQAKPHDIGPHVCPGWVVKTSRSLVMREASEKGFSISWIPGSRTPWAVKDALGVTGHEQHPHAGLEEVDGA